MSELCRVLDGGKYYLKKKKKDKKGTSKRRSGVQGAWRRMGLHGSLNGAVWTGLAERMTAEEATRPPPTRGFKYLESWRQALVLTFFRGEEDKELLTWLFWARLGDSFSLCWAGRRLFCGWRSYWSLGQLVWPRRCL